LQANNHVWQSLDVLSKVKRILNRQGNIQLNDVDCDHPGCKGVLHVQSGTGTLLHHRVPPVVQTNLCPHAQSMSSQPAVRSMIHPCGQRRTSRPMPLRHTNVSFPVPPRTGATSKEPAVQDRSRHSRVTHPFECADMSCGTSHDGQWTARWDGLLRACASNENRR